MAWLLDIDATKPRRVLPMRAEPACVPYKERVEYRRKHGFNPTGIHAGGPEIEDRFWPQTGHFIKKVGELPRILGVCGFYLVPKVWREVIERFEPGVHQFKHVPLFYKDGSPVEEEFHAINIRQAYHDIVDLEKSTAPKKNHPTRDYIFLTSFLAGQLYFKKSQMKNFHLWFPREILVYKIAMSNDLYAAIAETGGMNTIDTLEIEEL
ncbi:MAG: DUF1629 domain-containing protein [Pseudomonadota bacterium]